MFDKDDCGCECTKEIKCTDKIIITVLLVLLVFIIGIIVGATTELFTLIGLRIFIVIAVALGVLIIIKSIILSLCCNKKKC